jgi:Ca2+/Na+ antiporter
MGSFGLVRSTGWLTHSWLPAGLEGSIVLAALTGIPNLYTAVRLAMRRRGSAVMTEAINSGSLNIVVGLAIPALIFGVRAHTAGGFLDAGWLLLMTLVVSAMLAVGRGLSRVQGSGIIAAYLAFVAVRVYLSF